MTRHRQQIAELYGEFGPVVYRCCLRLLRDREAARDATQEVFLKLLRNVEALDDREKVLPWIFRVARNHCLNLRRDARRLEVAPDEAGFHVDAHHSPDRYRDVLLARRLLSAFDASTQAVAILVIIEGMAHEEVACELGLSRGTVARKLERFLRKTREHVAHAEWASAARRATAHPVPARSRGFKIAA